MEFQNEKQPAAEMAITSNLTTLNLEAEHSSSETDFQAPGNAFEDDD